MVLGSEYLIQNFMSTPVPRKLNAHIVLCIHNYRMFFNKSNKNQNSTRLIKMDY